jgi:hypothetical protein
LPDARLNPEKITHPFQLMAAWFAMLIFLVTALLTAATRIEQPHWAAGFLVISSVALSLVVMVAVFLMLTTFRPHLQDAKEYATWLREERRFKSTTPRPLEFIEAASIREETGSSKGREPETDNTAAEENTQFQVANSEGAEKLVETLRKVGIEAKVYQSGFHTAEANELHAAVWIGYRMGPSIVVPAIKAAITVWPQLRYLHISSDDESGAPDYIHDMLFIGGSTSTAIGYGLKPWSKSEINSLSPKLSIAQFHRLVRSKYRDGTTN